MKDVSTKLHAEQMARDIEHHRQRVLWLSSDAPVWGCGTPVTSHERQELLRSSVAILRNPILGSNTGPQTD
jgi:hypothetical protein